MHLAGTRGIRFVLYVSVKLELPLRNCGDVTAPAVLVTLNYTVIESRSNNHWNSTRSWPALRDSRSGVDDPPSVCLTTVPYLFAIGPSVRFASGRTTPVKRFKRFIIRESCRGQTLLPQSSETFAATAHLVSFLLPSAVIRSPSSPASALKYPTFHFIPRPDPSLGIHAWKSPRMPPVKIYREDWKDRRGKTDEGGGSSTIKA